MKKLFVILCCVLMSGPAWCAEECYKEGITVQEKGWLLVNGGEKKWKAFQCINNNSNKSKTPDENDYELVGKEFVQFCDNPNEAVAGWIDVDTNGNQTLRVKESDIKGKYLKGSNNISLSRFNNKNTACFYCGDGYTYSNGKCVEDMTQSCAPLADAKCKKSNNYLVESGGNGCFVCDQGLKASCRAGNRLFFVRAHIGKQSDVENQIWECNPATKTWTHREPSLCNGSVDLSADVKAGHATLTLLNPNRSSTHNNESSWVVDNGDICYKYACNDDWILSGGKCVQDADYFTICENSGGIYNEGTLRCDCAEIKGLKPTEDNKRCVCIDGDDYAWDKDAMNSTLGVTGACVKTQQAQQREEKQKQQAQKEQQQQQQNAKKKCADSGGSWSGSECECASSKNLKQKNNKECECISSDYNYDPISKQCTIKNFVLEKQACDQMKREGAQWNEYTKECVCDGGKTANLNTLKCEYPDGYEACNAKPDVADWVRGECVCKQFGYKWENNDCQKTAVAINAEIDTVYADIQNLESKYAKKISKWKDAEGNFNTARLASDSIAGVVLGTVGGVVTSTVIKKNQIEDGFEDLKCAIGGQTVATWGDEFQVGLQ